MLAQLLVLGQPRLDNIMKDFGIIAAILVGAYVIANLGKSNNPATNVGPNTPVAPNPRLLLAVPQNPGTGPMPPGPAALANTNLPAYQPFQFKGNDPVGGGIVNAVASAPYGIPTYNPATSPQPVAVPYQGVPFVSGGGACVNGVCPQ